MPAGRFLLMWVILAVAMSANGIMRELVLKRFTSASVADVLSAVIGIVIIGVITRWGFGPIAATPATTAQLWILSLALVLLTVGFETVLGRFVDHKSWSEIAQHYAIWRGELWLIVLGWLAATPFVWGRGWLPH